MRNSGSHRRTRTSRIVTSALFVLPLPVAVAAQEAGSGCDTVARILAVLPTVAIDRSTGEVRDDRTGEIALGCRVEVKGSASAFRESGAPEVVVRERLSELGWTEDYEYAADGPDGAAFAFRGGSVLCMFRASWDGGDDSDPNYVPDDRYDIVVECLGRSGGG